MKVLDHIIFLGRLKGMSRHDARNAGLEWLRKMDLEEWKDKKIEALSKGMAQKSSVYRYHSAPSETPCF